MPTSPWVARALFCLGAAAVVANTATCNHSSPVAPNSRSSGSSAPSPSPAVEGHTLSGTISEPIGTPIAGVTVTTRANPSGGPSRTGTAITDERGHYEIHDAAGCLWVKVTREGYEGGEWINCVNVNQDRVFDTTMQPVTRIDAGAALDDRVLANDMDWAVNNLTDEGCGPCKIVRIVAPQAGTLSVSITWPGRPDAMSLWAYGFPAKHVTGSNALVATFDTSSDREVVIYVAWDRPEAAVKEQPFHLESKMLVPGEPVAAAVTSLSLFSERSAFRTEHSDVTRNRATSTAAPSRQR